jgi:hypothetical protein
VKSLLLRCCLAAAAGAALVSPLLVSMAWAEPEESDGAKGPCTAKTFKFPAVEQACKAGGRDKVVKDIMRPAKNKANDKGIKINDKRVSCKSCHVDQDKEYKLTDNAIEDLRKLLPPPPK